MEDSSSEMRLGMIGCGLISHAHGRAALKSKLNVRFVSCASRRPEVAEAWAKSYGCNTYYTDYLEMLRSEALDGVVITTWPAGHRAQIENVLDHGVRFILCEKALATSGIDAFAIWNAANIHGATVVEAFMYRHHDVIAKAFAISDAGELGPIDSIDGVFHMFDPEIEDPDAADLNWRRRADTGGGVLHDFICYPVDAANKFSRSLPISVFATGSDSENFTVTNRLFAQIKYASDCIATVASSRKSCFRQSFTLTGPRGSLDIPIAWSIPGDVTLVKTTSPSFLAEEKTEYHFPRSKPHSELLIDLPVFSKQLDNFVRTFRGEERPGMPLASSVVNAFVLDALAKSYRSELPAVVELPASIIKQSEENFSE